MGDFDERLKIVPGKKVLARFKARLMDECKVSISEGNIVSAFSRSDIPDSMNNLLDQLNAFRRQPVLEK